VAALWNQRDKNEPQMKGLTVSLDVSSDLLAQAERGEVHEAAFVDCIRKSLPYAWETVSFLVAEREAAPSPRPFADNRIPPPDEHARGQLLRALASDAIRGALERHFGVRLAFQNCHRVAVFAADAAGGDAHTKFVSTRAQILNQSPAVRDC
jgi:hypothetical protein